MSEHAQARLGNSNGHLARLISFVLPSLGHMHLRRVRRAFVLAIRPAVLLVGTALLVLANPGAAAVSLIGLAASTVVAVIATDGGRTMRQRSISSSRLREDMLP